mmetsp:Transcript_29057/g.92747  ORF Transcript_29057/g.92747 Transcript_29057/m.92747 type:complete len:211 (-) Transcript_29057:246-878(-)
MPTQCRLNIEAYMRDKLKIPAEEVPVLCAQAYSEHGTTLAGLVHLGHEVDYDDWHLDVHGKLPYDEELSDDPELRAVLQSIPQPKWIFTNADEVHAEVCLKKLGIRHLFEGVICFESIHAFWASENGGTAPKHVVCKPSLSAFELALKMAGVNDASRAIFLDDSARNVKGAAAVGVYSVLVGRGEEPSEGASKACPRIHDLRERVPEIWH